MSETTRLERAKAFLENEVPGLNDSSTSNSQDRQLMTPTSLAEFASRETRLLENAIAEARTALRKKIKECDAVIADATVHEQHKASSRAASISFSYAMAKLPSWVIEQEAEPALKGE